ncbi:hypothetical protein EDB81DRAFT_858920 [Dactylonectria macrodidyma]|uniref:Uncharacterized protein n=1 Tax=Dactylonectria macrodidyma TaxID=307937 RepID=A0A9P9EAX9_9HYPO|nr:hypothetical protein EDB81DRAFT_858920 [Dactylonectria macrodidyma]
MRPILRPILRPEWAGQYPFIARQADGFILVYDVMIRKSFESLPRIHQTIFRSAGDNSEITGPWDRPPAKEATGIMTLIKRLWYFTFPPRETPSTAASRRRRRRKRTGKRTSRWKFWEQVPRRSSNPRRSEGAQKQPEVATPPQPPKPTMEEVRAKAEALEIQPGMFPFVVLGRESGMDLEPQWQVSQEEGEAFAREIGADFHLIRTNSVIRASDTNPQSFDVIDDLIRRIMLRRVFGFGKGSIGQ